MRCTYGIEASIFQQTYSAVFGSIEGGGAQDAIVVVDAATIKHDRFTVQLQSLLGRVLDGADAIRDGHDITLSLDSCVVEVWILGRPQAWLLYVDVFADRFSRTPPQLLSPPYGYWE